MDEETKLKIDTLYYELNPNNKGEVPPSFYETLEKTHEKYIQSELVIPFYQYCKSVIV